jgi:putative membrane protein
VEFLADADKAALQQAVASIEGRSSAEAVVVVRAQSGSYAHVDLGAGIVMGVAVLWIQLFSPWEFSLLSILVAPVAAGGATAWLMSRAPGVRRKLTREAARRRNVRTAARAEFLERGIDRTRGRTGLLVYVSRLERAAEVVGDRGIERVAPAGWSEAVAAIDRAVAGGEPGRKVAERIVALGDLLAATLPRASDDVDEIANVVVA